MTLYENEALPSIIINRRAKTQKKLGKILYEMSIENQEYSINELVKLTGCGKQTLSQNLGPLHKRIPSKAGLQKKIYILPEFLKNDIIKISEEIKKTETFKKGLARDKKKMVSVMLYILFYYSKD